MLSVPEQMNAESLALVHAEMLRLREAQSLRVASVRARSSAVLGAAGVTTTLTAVVAVNPYYVLAIIAFVFSSAYCVKSMWMRRITVKRPVAVMQLVGLKRPFEARLQLLVQLTDEYDAVEEGLKSAGGNANTAMGWFVAGLVTSLLVSLIAALIPVFSST
jgi:hypothetical protein